MAFVEPGLYSRGELDRVGNRIRHGIINDQDLAVLDNWRASHLYVLNTFQASLRNRRSRSNVGEQITIAQRLKRRPTIIDKLSREEGMSLSRMHDIAGCRIIFPTLGSLEIFRGGVLSSRASHELLGGGNRYNYIETPKPSGYRGIHDVYKYNVGSAGGIKWNGLRVEIQYRTYIQHAWATAVEISDIVNATRLKFSQANRDISRLFLLCSEILSRYHEDRTGFCTEVDSGDLLEEFRDLESKIHAISRLRSLTSSAFQKFARTSKLFILVNYTVSDKEGHFEAEGFTDNASAVVRYSELEKQLEGKADVVLVGASQQDAVKLAYTNYFSDASEFIAALDTAVEDLA
ncbi:RelA/SpoT domain-containing protein [Labrys monachus]|uniref:PpGpp synthetase/RelA/SpoT-type nucleotidyltransferase n=1 Tax=Labrys monachus TaxID=217067 RepID=A0ABU0FCG1_9HYPH|nr:RelA/SpoT domain-containing protein [Labrys monachus]MDQ0391803.1 ppGpp synthetase/RelA/SpoT-type nucleotidyltransferase [Labrys monachus]